MDLKEFFKLNIAERAKVCEEIAKHSTYSYNQVYGTLNGLFERYMIFGFVSPEDVPMALPSCSMSTTIFSQTSYGNTIAVDFAIETIRFLLRRYCLVDKEVARTAYQQAMEQGKHAEE